MPASGKPYGKAGKRRQAAKPEDRSLNDPGPFRGEKTKFGSKSKFGRGGRVRSAKS